MENNNKINVEKWSPILFSVFFYLLPFYQLADRKIGTWSLILFGGAAVIFAIIDMLHFLTTIDNSRRINKSIEDYVKFFDEYVEEKKWDEKKGMVYNTKIIMSKEVADHMANDQLAAPVDFNKLYSKQKDIVKDNDKRLKKIDQINLVLLVIALLLVFIASLINNDIEIHDVNTADVFAVLSLWLTMLLYLIKSIKILKL
ncbi:hypothetical protein [Bacillus sp. AFS088145]|uniref:hypothetical protein n=1 Tax=Bacillus sp. AFS088145 TaxID=2033514 RepID=UPI000BF31AB5|nr:hypothetical protein [Bacillus sp. AFS088145]PFH86459.1 hypothetical protein COI44_12630 [Bacillus sp. AFS088145]